MTGTLQEPDPNVTEPDRNLTELRPLRPEVVEERYRLILEYGPDVADRERAFERAVIECLLERTRRE